MANGFQFLPSDKLEAQIFKLLNYAYRCQEATSMYEALTPVEKGVFNAQVGSGYMSAIKLAPNTTIDMRIDPKTGVADYLVKVGFAISGRNGRIELTDYDTTAEFGKLLKTLEEIE